MSVTQQECDYLVVGGGVLGVCIAWELRRRHHGARVVLIDKEDALGQHASGRNSGVLHAGFYYSSDSLKARFTREGNRWLTAWCAEHELPLRACGKLVVVRHASELPVLDELHRRGQTNGVPLQPVDATEARAIEPRVRTVERALFSPSTASVDPGRVVDSLAQAAGAAGVDIRTATRYQGRRDGVVVTSTGRLRPRYLVNTAGLYADRLAHEHGFARHLAIVPFKGLYLKSDEPPGALRTLVYPVPDLQFPFLGVHCTVTVEGRWKIGPTAFPALWREQYAGMQNFRWDEMLDVGQRVLRLFLQSDGSFQRQAWREWRKTSRRHLVAGAQQLVDGIDAASCRRWGPAGIRAQLVDTRRQRLMMDFVLEGDDRSLHVLNAVSPAFTTSMPFARHVCDTIQRLQAGEAAVPGGAATSAAPDSGDTPE